MCRHSKLAAAATPLLFALLFEKLLCQGVVAQPPACPDGSTPECPDGSVMQSSFPPCSGGPPVCGDGSVLPPPPGMGPPGSWQGGPPGGQQGGPGGPSGGGGGPPPGPQGGQGGGPGGPGGRPGGKPAPPNAPFGTGPHAAPILGDVGFTTVSGEDKRTGNRFEVGEDIYGPFEAGFSSMQDFVLKGVGCTTPSDGYVAGGIDTHTAEQMMAHQCHIELPRVENDGAQGYVALLDECGGHTEEYHFHESMKCLYDGKSEAHSAQIGKGNDDGLLYGKWENTKDKASPLLDACGGHFGKTPESPDKEVYHYHVQDLPPFTFGCYGPNDDGSLVTVEQCREFYPGCDGDVVEVETAEGKFEYDPWCPCFDAKGSNTGKDIAPLKVFSASDVTKAMIKKVALRKDSTRRSLHARIWWPLAFPAALVSVALLFLYRRTSGVRIQENQDRVEVGADSDSGSHSGQNTP